MKIFELVGLLRLQGSDEFKSRLKDVEKDAETSTKDMQQSFDRLRKTIIGAFSVKVIADFGKALVSASAQVAANNAQFAATFREVGEAASKAFSDVAKATGVMETRLRTAGTKAFSQFKGAGLDAVSALSQTERYLNLASDAAAYYDISLEDADVRLRSFIRGNVEAGDMIGLFTSETQRNSRALEDYGKKYIELTEDQKQMVMLNIAEEIYKQSGAIGQASREAGEFANVSGNLAESWLQLRATLGEPILEAVNSAMQSLSATIADLNTWISQNRETLSYWVDILKAAVSMIASYVVAMKSMEILKSVKTMVDALTTSQLLLNSAMSGNVILKLISSITGLLVLYRSLKRDSKDLSTVTKDLEGITKEYNDIVDTLKGNTDGLTEAEKALYETRKETLKQDMRLKAVNLAASYSGTARALKEATEKSKAYSTELEHLLLVQNEGRDAAYDEIARLSQQRAGVGSGSPEGRELTKQISDLQQALKMKPEELTAKIQKISQATIDASSHMQDLTEDIESGVVTAANAIYDGLLDINVFANNQDLYKQVAAHVARLYEAAQQGVEDAGGNGGGLESDLDSEGEELPALTRIYQELAASMDLANAKHEAFGDGFDVNAEKAESLRSAIESLLMEGLDPTSETIQTLIAQMRSFESASQQSVQTVSKSFQDMAREFNDNVMSVFQNVYSSAMSLVNAIQDFQNQALENEVNMLEKQYEELQEINEQKLEDKKEDLDEENDALKKQLYEGQISYKQYADAVKANEEALSDYEDQLADEEAAKEEELLKKKDELQRKQFEAEKANSIAQVWVDAASATVRAFAENFWPVALGITALIASAAAVQTATIASQQYVPALAEGGIVDRPTLSLIGEDGKEAIVPLENNTEWTRNVAEALEPAIRNVSDSGNNGVREEINTLRQMIAEFFLWVRSGNVQVVMDGQVVGRLVSPYIDSRFGTSSRLRARGV